MLWGSSQEEISAIWFYFHKFLHAEHFDVFLNKKKQFKIQMGNNFNRVLTKFNLPFARSNIQVASCLV